ncbi:MAG TPA: hypothetical protein VK856_04935 [Anaerolineaceae bacterium]|nr:hypothetical protein [Anaerolineaceae bacterium]
MEKQKNFNFFLWIGLFLGIVSSLIFYMFKLRENKKDLSTAFVNKYIHVSDNEEKKIIEMKTETKKIQKDSNKDNLHQIKGIGPAIENLLNENLIFSFQDLSLSKVEDLRNILEKKNFRLANPETWPEQAKLLLSEK